MGQEVFLRGKLFLIWFLVLISLYLMVFPKQAFGLVQFVPFVDKNLFSEDVAVRVFTGVNALLVIFLSSTGGAVRQAMRAPKSLDALGIALPTPDSIRDETYAEPCHVLLIYDEFPSFQRTKRTSASIKKAAILGNLKPIYINQKSLLKDFIKEGRVLAILTDEKYYEEFSRYLSGSSITYIGLTKSDSVTANAGPQKISLCAPDGDWSMVQMYTVASALKSLHSFDTPRGVGFEGNWLGTYGLVSLKQDENGNVQGVYWYGGGKIFNGKCIIDAANERLILNYSWSQENNEGGVGSTFRGNGIFVIPAGFEFFYGFWYDKENLLSSQSWAGARVSRDITDDILRGGPIAVDFGLGQHAIENIVT